MRQIKVEINGIDYNIRELSIADYYELKHKILMQDAESAFEVVSRLTDLPKEVLQKLKYEHWLELLITVQGELNRSFKTQESKTETRLKVGDKEYGLIDLQNATIGEFMDLDILVSSPTLETDIHKIIAILYRPFVEADDEIVFESYDNARCMKRADQFLQLPLLVAQQALSFFLDFGKASLKLTLEYSIHQIVKEGKLTTEEGKRLRKIILESLEVGSIHYLYSLETMYSRLKEQQKSTTNSPLTTSPEESTSVKRKKDIIKNLFRNIGLN